MSESRVRTGGADGRAGLVTQLTDAVDGLLTLDCAFETTAELRQSLRSIEIQLSRLRYAQLSATAELVERKLPGELGFRGVPQFLQATLGCTGRAAKDLALAVCRFGPRRALTGELLQPALPVTAGALTEGGISTDHAREIGDAVLALPDAVRAEHGDRVETVLVEHARTLDPVSLRALAQRIIAHLDPDGPEPAEPEGEAPAGSELLARRRLFLTRHSDQTGELTGMLSPTCQALWETILTPLAAKRDTEALGPDLRTQAQRWHDAFEHAGRLLLSSGDLPDSAGAATTLVLTLGLTDLEQRIGKTTTQHGGVLSISDALRIAADGQLMPVVLDDTGGVLAYGRARRLASPAQRKALFARDRGCTFPGCGVPAARAEIHHTTDWAKGGRTDLASMTITCGYHNNEAPRQGWTTLMINGIPHWKPPCWKDPHQNPIRNHIHHPEVLISTKPDTPKGRGEDDPPPDG